MARNAKKAVLQADQKITKHMKKNPYKTVGLSVVGGLLAGLLFGRRR